MWLEGRIYRLGWPDLGRWIFKKINLVQFRFCLLEIQLSFRGSTILMCTTRWTLTWWELKAVFLAAREAFVGIFLILSQTLISRSQSQDDFKHINPLSWDYLFIVLFPLERIYMDAGPARSALNNCDFNIYCIFDMLVMETYMAYFGQLWKWSHYDI